ncbi:MAG: peptidylprolyl isomerase [Paludibacter sp.]|nr:peptidylprolyl isomerase [Paludibacter sp.]
MATLEKIRSKGVLLIAVVGFALLSFIIGDFLTQGSTFFNKSKENVAEINGETVNIADYQDLLDQTLIFQKYESGQSEIDEQTMQQIRAFVWDQMIREKLLYAEAEEIGLTITKEELSDRLIGNNIHPMIQQRRFFADETGRFNRAMLLQFLNFKDDEPKDAQMEQQLSDYKKLWIFLEKTVKFSLLQEKYNSLVTNSIVSNSIEAKANFNSNAPLVDASYFLQPYYAIADTAVSVSNKEIKDRYNKQIKQYKQEPNVSISFVSFNIQPAKEDFEEAEKFINDLKNEFATTTDVVELVNSNSDTPYTGRNYTTSTVPLNLKDFAFSGKKGDVTGPFFANNTYTMARIMENGIMLPDSVKLRHIFLLSSESGKTDSILNAIRSGANFGELAKKYSAVKQTADNNGEIGWILDGDQALDKEILNGAFSKKVNEVFTFKNAQGTQIIQIMEKTAPKAKVKLAILERSVIASTKTESKIFNEAKRFAAELEGSEFDSLARKNNYVVRQANEIFQTNEQILNIPQSRQIVRWIFDNSKGDVSDVFECDKELIVAAITDVNKSKYRSIDKVSSQIRAEIIKDKKAALIIENLGQQIKKGATLSDLAIAVNQEVKAAQGVFFSAYQFGMEGFEPAVIGKTTTLKQNQISAPIKGNAGVFVVQATNVQKNEQKFDLAAEKRNLTSSYKYALPNSIMMSMRDKAEVKDNRLNFY